MPISVKTIHRLQISNLAIVDFWVTEKKDFHISQNYY